MERLINRRQQGDLGEASAVEWLTRTGALVALPIGHSPDFDLIAQVGDRLLRIQVKTSTQTVRTPNGHLHFAVSLSTCGGNQSWTGVSKVFDPDRVDYLFALTSSGRRWFIPATDLDAKTSIQLGGIKYAEYEIEAAAPIHHLVYRQSAALESSTPGEYPSGQRTAAVNRQAQPSQVRILPPPSDSGDSPEPPAVGRTRMSTNHQVTVPLAVAAASDLEPGDRFRVESDGQGRFVMTRIEEYMKRHVEQLALPHEQDGEDEDPAGAERRAPD
jgi:bifunctional DNA-binding transcriptional regulator/antitoxin component of YhaV-PrlF toxin-antitoxin module